MVFQICKQLVQRSPSIISVRFKHTIYGPHPRVAKSLNQWIEEQNPSDPTLDFKVNIGFAPSRIRRADVTLERANIIKKNRSNPEMEKLARTGRLAIDLDKMCTQYWQSLAPTHIKQVAEHYGVFDHLFGDAYFFPVKKLDIFYTVDDSRDAPVYFGNIIKPNEASKQPTINYEAESDSLWTLVLTNPDGHLLDNDMEYVHWMIGNIPGSEVSKGEEIWDYLQPFPPRGTGYQRFIFILYKQTKKVDFSKLKKSKPCLSLSERTFSTLPFYREHQDILTPAGLAFFQSDWHDSVSDFYHNCLNMKEPVFEYDFAPPYLKRQVFFPKRYSFNRYMDRHRDQKKVAEEFLLRRLKKEHPFMPPKPPLRFPNAIKDDRDTPSWLVQEKRRSRLKFGRINDY